jgi:hypothetical protein
METLGLKPPGFNRQTKKFKREDERNETNADRDSVIYLNADPDPWSQTNADRILVRLSNHKTQNRKPGLFVNFGHFHCSRIRFRIPNTDSEFGPRIAKSMLIRIHNTSSKVRFIVTLLGTIPYRTVVNEVQRT